jgi:hypothetical protein
VEVSEGEEARDSRSISRGASIVIAPAFGWSNNQTLVGGSSTKSSDFITLDLKVDHR